MSDTFAVVGDNRPDWIQTELAVQSLGVVAVDLYQDSVGDELAAKAFAAGAKFFVVDDQEQVTLS
jgi:long-chain acyl-CoA synthetase